MGDSKIILTIPRMAFCNSKGSVRGGWGVGGSVVELEIRSCGEILRIGIRRHEGLDLEFPQRTDNSVYLENTYFMVLISLQINPELMALVGFGTCVCCVWVNLCEMQIQVKVLKLLTASMSIQRIWVIQVLISYIMVYITSWL